MAQKKKLQIFVSSTYADLREERQAAVEAILTAGHIPAGMELFAAGDESQMSVIKRWIDSSDVYLLILGGRYGSIEPRSQKSYIQLEYEYAAEQGKPLFAVVIEGDYLEEKVRSFGTKVIETEHPQELKEFRALVLSKMVRFWRDPRDIKLAILETIAELAHRSELAGWIPGNEAVNALALAEEIARVTTENATLRAQVARLAEASVRYNGLTFEEMYKMMTAKVDTTDFEEHSLRGIQEVARIFGDSEPALIHMFWMLSDGLRKKANLRSQDLEFLSRLEALNLIERDEEAASRNVYKLTETGKQFLVRLRLERGTEEAERFIFQAK